MNTFPKPIGRAAFFGWFILGGFVSMALQVAFRWAMYFATVKGQESLPVVSLIFGVWFVAFLFLVICFVRFAVLPRLASIGAKRWYALLLVIPPANLLFVLYLLLCPAQKRPDTGVEQNRKYEEITKLSREAVDQALRENVPETLLRAVIAVSMHDADWRYAQDLCVRLSSHPHFNVRGNAVLGFGHIARVHRQLDRSLVQPIIQAALCNENDYIRGQAVCAMDDTTFFLKWHYDEKDEG